MIRASINPCSFFAAWYSKFSERSPCARAVAIASIDRLAASGPSSSSSSACSCACAAGVRTSPSPAMGSVAAAAGAAAATAAPAAARDLRHAVNGEGGELLRDVRRVAVGAVTCSLPRTSSSKCDSHSMQTYS